MILYKKAHQSAFLYSDTSHFKINLNEFDPKSNQNLNDQHSSDYALQVFESKSGVLLDLQSFQQWHGFFDKFHLVTPIHHMLIQ